MIDIDWGTAPWWGCPYIGRRQHYRSVADALLPDSVRIFYDVWSALHPGGEGALRRFGGVKRVWGSPISRGASVSDAFAESLQWKELERFGVACIRLPADKKLPPYLTVLLDRGSS